MARIVIQPLDQVMASYGKALARLSGAEAHKVMARAINYEGKKAFTVVKRALAKQTSIPRDLINAGTRFKPAGVAAGNALEAAIIGTGRELPLSKFGARQFKAGVRAKVWGKLETFRGQFMGPRPGVIAAKLKGRTWVRRSKARLPIKQTYGPSIPKELVKDQTAATFQAAVPSIVDRVGKEIAAVLRGF
jgi:hypothetical protein